MLCFPSTTLSPVHLPGEIESRLAHHSLPLDLNCELCSLNFGMSCLMCVCVCSVPASSPQQLITERKCANFVGGRFASFLAYHNNPHPHPHPQLLPSSRLGAKQEWHDHTSLTQGVVCVSVCRCASLPALSLWAIRLGLGRFGLFFSGFFFFLSFVPFPSFFLFPRMDDDAGREGRRLGCSLSVLLLLVSAAGTSDPI